MPAANWQTILEHDVLPAVEKPARYTGGEWNMVRKDWDAAELKFVVMYPDTYELGMSNLAIQIVYDIVNRREDALWAVAARRVEVAELDAAGEQIELIVNNDERTLVVDGERAFGSVPVLERLGEREGSSYVARAQRLDERLWEVEVNPL